MVGLRLQNLLVSHLLVGYDAGWATFEETLPKINRVGAQKHI